MIRRRPTGSALDVGLAWETQIETAPEAILVGYLWVDVLKILQRWQHDLRRERQRCGHGPWRDGSVVGAVGCIVIERAFDALDAACCPARPVARGQAPKVFTIARKPQRVSDGAFPPHVGGAAAVLAVVNAVVAREGVLDAAQIQPDVRILVDEKRAAVVLRLNYLPSLCRNDG